MISLTDKTSEVTFRKRFIKKNGRYICVDIDDDNFLGDDREKKKENEFGNQVKHWKKKRESTERIPQGK